MERESTPRFVLPDHKTVIFSASLRDERDLDALNYELVSVVRKTIQPSHVSEGAIEATPPESDPTQKDTERPWWRRVLEGIFNRISGLFGG